MILLLVVLKQPAVADFTLKIDSLTIALKTADESEKPAYYNLIAWKIRNSNPEKSYDMAISSFKLSAKHSNMKQLAFSHNILGLYHAYRNNSDSALYYFNQQIIIARENHLDAFEAYAYQNIGSMYYRRALFDDALKNYESTEKVYQRIGSMSNLAKAKTNIGLVYFEKGNYSKALNYYHQAQDIYRDSITNKEGLGALLNNMGDVLFELLDFDRALNYYQESIAINKEHNDFRRLCTSLRLAGKTHAMLGGYQEAEINLNDALMYAKRLNDPVAILECVKEKARLYFLTGSFEMARDIVNTHSALLNSTDSDLLKAEMFLIIGTVDLKEKRYSEAEEYFMKALKCAVEKEALNLEAQINQVLFELHADIGQFQKSSEYARKYIANKNQLFDESLVRTVISQQRFEQERSEKEIANFKLKEVELLKERDNRKWWFTIIVFAFVIFAAICGFWVAYLMWKQKSIKLLHKMKDEIHHQKIINIRRDQEIRSVEARLEGEENERERVARELHDGIGGTLGGIKLQLANFSLPEDEAIQLEKMLDSVYMEIRTISRNLTPPAIRDYLFTDIIQSYLDDIESKTAIIITHNSYPQDEINSLNKELKTDLYRIFQELVTNICKHSKASEVTIQLLIHTGYINLLVEDNGIGFEKTRGFEGIGLVNISSRVKLLRGNFEISSFPNQGTVVNIDIPYKNKL